MNLRWKRPPMTTTTTFPLAKVDFPLFHLVPPYIYLQRQMLFFLKRRIKQHTVARLLCVYRVSLVQIIGSEVTLFLSLNIQETLGDEGALIGSVQVMCVRLPLDVIETLGETSP